MESWDIGNAFLQGLSFKELQDQAKSLGIETQTERKIYLSPPDNVWRHFRTNPKSNINIQRSMYAWFVLELLKCIYGLVDAPLMFQLALIHYIKAILKGSVSVYDENFVFWNDAQGNLLMVFTIHVDDIFAAYRPEIGEWAHAMLEKRFGKLKAKATVDGDLACSGELIFSLVDRSGSRSKPRHTSDNPPAHSLTSPTTSSITTLSTSLQRHISTQVSVPLSN